MERVWIYQANRPLTEGEAARILDTLLSFTSHWKAHGKQLAAWAEVRYGLFVIIGVNEAVAPPTGCSIDKSVHLLKALEQELGITLFDRMQVAFKEGDDVVVVPRQEFERLLAIGAVNEETTVFNNLVQNTDELASEWEIPLKDSWHSKVFSIKP